MSPVGTHHNNDLGRGPVIMGVLWSATGLAILVVTSRLRIRAKSSNLFWDDWFMVAAAVLQLVAMSFISIAYTHGYGRHDADLTIDEMILALKWSWLQMIPGTLVSIFARISAAILLFRLFSIHLWFKWFLLVYTPVQSVIAILVILVNFLQITPQEGLWNPTVVATTHWNSRITSDISYLGQSLFTFSDLAYVLIPVYLIWKLQMPLSRKIGLAVIMGLSVLTAAASVMKTVVSQKLAGETTEPQYTSTLAALFSNLEQVSVIIMSCIPTMRTSMTALGLSGLSSLARAFGYGKSKGAINSKSYGQYHDIERNSHRLESVTDDRCGSRTALSPMRTDTKVGRDPDLAAAVLPANVRRVDQVIISYQDRI